MHRQGLIGGVINSKLGVIGPGGLGGVLVGHGPLGVGNGVELLFERGCSNVTDTTRWDIVIIEVRFSPLRVSRVDEVARLRSGDDAPILAGCGLTVVAGHYGSMCAALGELVNVSARG